MRFFSLPALLIAGLLSVLIPARPVSAHFVWIDIADDAGTHTARVMFGEDPEPGEARLLGKIAKTQAWVRKSDGSTGELALSPPVGEDQPAALTARLPADAAAVEAACDYGVYTRAPGGVRLHYYATCLADATSKSAPSNRLKLEIVPALHDGRLEVAVFLAGKPDASAELIVLDQRGQSSEIKLDPDARASIELPKSGRLALRAKHVASDEAGEISGQKYAQTWYCATLVLPGINGEAKAGGTAAEALARARDGRAIWHNFPGFTTDVAIRSDEGMLDAQATIDASGVVTLSGDRAPLHDWAEQQLQSLVQHRMPDGEVAEGQVTFVAEPTAHPLGQLIDLGDPERQSRYRLKDDVIYQVNRLMGPQRFTISVLSIERNKEGKYLPQAFAMSFWDAAGGELSKTLSYWNTWRRVGNFDLPEVILEVEAVKPAAKTRRLTLSNWQLLDRRSAQASQR
jgi:Protein of unknown function (DUF3386)